MQVWRHERSLQVGRVGGRGCEIVKVGHEWSYELYKRSSLSPAAAEDLHGCAADQSLWAGTRIRHCGHLGVLHWPSANWPWWSTTRKPTSPQTISLHDSDFPELPWLMLATPVPSMHEYLAEFHRAQAISYSPSQCPTLPSHAYILYSTRWLTGSSELTVSFLVFTLFLYSLYHQVFCSFLLLDNSPTRRAGRGLPRAGSLWPTGRGETFLPCYIASYSVIQLFTIFRSFHPDELSLSWISPNCRRLFFRVSMTIIIHRNIVLKKHTFTI